MAAICDEGELGGGTGHQPGAPVYQERSQMSLSFWRVVYWVKTDVPKA